MKKILLWILTATCLLSACQGEDRNSGDNTSLETFSVQLNPQNTLRADVEVNMKTATTYHIEYWEKDARLAEATHALCLSIGLCRRETVCCAHIYNAGCTR